MDDLELTSGVASQGLYDMLAGCDGVEAYLAIGIVLAELERGGSVPNRSAIFSQLAKIMDAQLSLQPLAPILHS